MTSIEIIMEKKTDKTMKLTCPMCGRSLLIHEKFIKCTEPSCAWFLWRTIAGRFLRDSDLLDLLLSGQTDELDGFTSSKTGNPFRTALSLNEDGKIEFVFRNRGRGRGRRLGGNMKW